MTAQPDNVRPLHPTPAAEALAEARAIAAGHLDRILTDEATKPADPAEESWRELIATGDAIRIADRAWPGGIVTSLIQDRDRALRERDQARGLAALFESRIESALDEVRPHTRFRSVVGGLARNVESALDPREEPSPAA